MNLTNDDEYSNFIRGIKRMKVANARVSRMNVLRQKKSKRMKTMNKENEYEFAPRAEQRRSGCTFANIQSNYSTIASSNMLSPITSNIPSNFTQNIQHITSSRIQLNTRGNFKFRKVLSFQINRLGVNLSKRFDTTLANTYVVS